jgi:hypothetical protein
VNGYLHPSYAESLAEFGTPRELSRCGGWIVQRQIPGFSDYDALGCYPLFACQDWSQLSADLEEIGEDLVSLALVTDPFGSYTPAYLQQCFKDVAVPFKEHFVTDLGYSINDIVSSHHRYYARKVLKKISVEPCLEPIKFLDEWQALYDILIAKHNVRGIRAFSRTAFVKQLSIPGLIMLRAVSEDTTIGAQLWLLDGEVGYSHLTAVSEMGYKLRASYGLYWYAIEYLADRVRWLDLGAGAGMASDANDGLSQFKRGWSTGTRTAYFCGRIFNREKYTEIVRAKGVAATDYFPAYRKGEFA